MDAGPAPVTVGGNVSGLASASDAGASDAGAASAVVLQNNAKDDLTVAKNGPFTFATKQGAGSAYAVTVKTQPTGYTCAVTKGTGTATSNVTDVAVACAANDYEVSVDVSGLSGKGLEVELNGANTTTVNANGVTKFTAKVKYGSNYAVTVKTQPTRPTGKCTIASGTGTVSGNASVAVVCADDILPNASYAPDQNHAVAAGDLGNVQFPVSLAFDGTSYWVGSIQQNGADPDTATKFSSAFVLQQSYPLQADFRLLQLFSPGGNGTQISAFGYNQPDIFSMNVTGGLTTRVTPNPAIPTISWPSFNNGATEILVNTGGTVLRRDATTGAAAADLVLAGYTNPAVGENYWDQHIFAASGYLITVALDDVTVRNATTGALVKTAKLTGGPAITGLEMTFNSIAVSYANGHLWLWKQGATLAEGTWYGYDLGL
jgi:hypothetical protein